MIRISTVLVTRRPLLHLPAAAQTKENRVRHPGKLEHLAGQTQNHARWRPKSCPPGQLQTAPPVAQGLRMSGVTAERSVRNGL